MSQITRCPSCATSFKVVADQLRISEGWVRCGQCNEVFDASAHLLPLQPLPPPPVLLPDVPLTDTQPVPAPAPALRTPDAAGGWGVVPLLPPLPPSEPLPSPGLGAALRTAHQGGDQFPNPSDESAPLVASSHGAASLADPPPPALEVPSPAVPAFLTTESPSAGDGVQGLASATPFVWRAPMSIPPLQEIPAVQVSEDPVPSSQDVPSAQRVGSKQPMAFGVNLEQVPEGYELPFAELPESEWPADVLQADAPFSAPSSSEGSPDRPALEVSAPPKQAVVGGDEHRLLAVNDLPPPGEPAQGNLPPAASRGSERLEADPVMTFVADDSAAVDLPDGARTLVSEPDAADDETEATPDHEVSFVRAARRKAFWRRPAVRLALALLGLLALAALTLQVAVQERDRLVAMDAGLRPWLMKVCAPLQCEIAPLQQIADVVIDSSSFTKARGDSYQLALTMKNQAGIPLAMPAIELTLTDAQDQPVLRRVLLPADMAAPAELPARGEWSASVTVIVTTGGARVAGYRLLAFYP